MPNYSTNRYTRSVCFWACCAALCFSSPRAFADTDSIAFDAPTLQAVTNLARAMAASSPASVDDNVAAILALLQSSFVYTLPQWSRQVSTPISAGIANGLFASGYSARTIPSTEDSYLYKILEQLQIGLPPIASDVRSISGSMTNLSALSSALLLIDQTLQGRSYGPTMWHSHLDESQYRGFLYQLTSIEGTFIRGFDDFSRGLDQIYDYLPSLAQQPPDLSGIQQRLDSIDNFLQTTDEAVLQSGNNGAAGIDYAVQQQQQEDDATIGSITPENVEGYFGEPEMPSYTPASDGDVSDVDRDGLLDSLDSDGPSHSPILTLISSSDFKSATGVSGSMQYNLAEGPVYSFVGELSDISQASYYGLLAVFSALLFWRKQTEISAVVKGTNFSRV